MSYKKIMPFILGAGMLGGCAIQREGNLSCYVVRDRANNMISFENVAGMSVKRVMTFNTDELPLYHDIHIGDTIGCMRQFSDTQLVIDAGDADIRLIIRPNILRALKLQQQTALRDSLINQMNMNQK